MGCGKTTFGRALSAMCDVSFIDLDDYIERKSGKKINEIFCDKGEIFFRQLESEALREIADSDYKVVSCGGGTPCFNNNMEFINKKGVTMWLDVSIERLFSRLWESCAERPLIAQLSPTELRKKIEDDCKLRSGYYQKSSIRWDGNQLDNYDEIVDNIFHFVRTYPELGFAITKPL